MTGQVTPTTNTGNTITTLNWGISSAYAGADEGGCIEVNNHYCGGTTGSDDDSPFTNGGGMPTGDPDSGNNTNSDNNGGSTPPPPPPPKTERQKCLETVAVNRALCNVKASASRATRAEQKCNGLPTATGTVSTPVVGGSVSVNTYEQCIKTGEYLYDNAIDVCIFFEKTQLAACP